MGFLVIINILGLAIVARCDIYVRKGHHIQFDSPTDAFKKGEGVVELQDRGICSAIHSSKLGKQQDEIIENDKQVQQRQLMMEDDWTTTQLKTYSQSYKGIPFYASSLVFSYDTLTGKFERRDNQRLKRFDVKDADRLLSQNKLSSSECLRSCQNSTNDIGEAEFAQFEDYFYIAEGSGGKLRLIKKISFRNMGGSDWACLVDVISPGKVIRYWRNSASIVKQIESNGGNVKTSEYYFGPRNTGARYKPLRVKQIDSSGVQCSLENGEIQIFDSCTNVSSPVTFNCDKGLKGKNSESFSPKSDCHYFADRYQDFITNVMRVSPWYPGSRKNVRIIVKEEKDCEIMSDPPFCRGYDVAIYYPTLNAVVMSNGCPNTNSKFYHMCTCPDVVAHELAHALTATYSNLEYGSGFGGIPDPEDQSGLTEASAINEAFSDIIGVAFEYWLEAATDFLIGERCTKGSKPIRSLINSTNSLWKGIDNIEDLAGNFAGTRCSSHICSGIFGRAFYHLATTKGWDPLKAAKPFVLANQCYWRHTVLMREAACSVLNAATTLYSSTVADDVSAAFAEVGIDDVCIKQKPIILEDCETSSLPLSEVSIADLVGFMYTVPENYSGHPEAYIHIEAEPSSYGVLWRRGSSLPNFADNENGNLRGYGNGGNQYMLTKPPRGNITFAIYVTQTELSYLGKSLRLTACSKKSKPHIAPLQVSNVDGDDCRPSMEGGNWKITRDTSLYVVKVKIPPPRRVHRTYKFSMVINDFPDDSRIYNQVRIKLFIGRGTIATDAENAFFSETLTHLDNYSAETVLGTSTTPGIAADYYITLVGYISSVSVTKTTYKNISVTVCDIQQTKTVSKFEMFSSLKFRLIAASSRAEPSALSLLILSWILSIW